jgi:hypothetical protein
MMGFALRQRFFYSLNGLFHRFWEVEPEFEFARQILFFKNLGLAAGLLVIAGSAKVFERKS